MSAITQKEYGKRTAKWWKGRQVKSLVELQNGWAALPPGTLFTIHDKYSGFDLRSEPCACCGVKVFIGRVSPHKLELVEASEPADV